MHRRNAKAVLLLVAGAVTLGLLTLAWPTGPRSSEAQQDTMHNCPQAGKWAISVWSGDNGTDTSEALATCGAGAVVVAYSIDPDTQGWLRWFAGRPEVSNLETLDSMQGVIALGTVGTTGGRIVFRSDRDGYEIYVMNADGTGVTRLTNNLAYDDWPAWSPDGSKIAFASEFGITVMHADGSGLTELTRDPWALDKRPAWSPDGSRIAFSGLGAVLDDDVYVMNADGSGRTNLTANQANDSGPAWSPDSSTIAFTSDRDGNSEIYSMTADGSHQTRLTDNPALDAWPAWSPDGLRIAFGSDRAGNLEIYLMNADGTGLLRLTDDPDDDYTPTWSPDASRIAFVSKRDGNPEIYAMNADGTAQTRITYDPGSDAWPDWSSGP